MHKFVQGSQSEPAAGVEISFVPSESESFRLLTLHAQLKTSAVVSYRYPHFKFVATSGEVLHEVTDGNGVAANNTVQYDLAGGGGNSGSPGYLNNSVVANPLPDFWWPAGTRIVTVTAGLDVCDQWSNIVFCSLVGDEYEHLRWLEKIASQIGG